MINFETFGTPGLFLRYSGDYLDSARSLPASVLSPTVTKYCRFTAGVTGLVTGLRLTGASSSGVINVESVIITSGTLAGSDATGILFFSEISGTIQADENLDNGVTTYCISRTGVLTLPPEYKYGAKCLLVQCETNAIRILMDGSSPTHSTETGDASYGIILNALDSIPIKGWKVVSQFKVINAVAASNGVANVLVYYGGQE